ncbi:MAG: TrkH family potassium uptake protein, partial [Blautia sp.]|nr:TrkH family potassium uptake protein [Blautia sp.]
PGSTAGGVKTTTLAIALLVSRGTFKRQKAITVFGRSLAWSIMREAFALLTLYFSLLMGGGILLSGLEGLPLLPCLFECASALGTVGLTLGLTPSLSSASKFLLMGMMFFGRVGGVTFAFAALGHAKSQKGQPPEEVVMVG